MAKLFEVLQLNPDGLQQLKIREKSKGTARLPQIAKLVIWAIKFGRDHHYYAVQAAEGFDWKGRSPKRAADLIRLANDLIAATALLEEADKSQDKAA
ncbi:MAG: hypothetical protein HC934_02980 [Acaryochloridaceae cyanobacterium SU_2_1]|nr:hypothetical protein [Acaryochloridaceae cyanobacterium SU_2_1]